MLAARLKATPHRNVQGWGNNGRGDGRASRAAFPCTPNSVPHHSDRCILRHHCRDLADRALAMDRRRQRRALGFQEPVLRLLPFPFELAAFRRDAVLESVSLWRTSERRRSAIADLRTGLFPVGVVRSRSVHPRVRYSGLRASARRRARDRSDRLARGMAGRGLRARGLHLHVRRRGVGTPAAYRHDSQLRTVSGRTLVVAARAVAPLDRVRFVVLSCGRLARARAQPGRAAVVLRPDRRRHRARSSPRRSPRHIFARACRFSPSWRFRVLR